MAASLASRNHLFLASLMVAVGSAGASRAHSLDDRSAPVCDVREAVRRSPLPGPPRPWRAGPPADVGSAHALLLTLIMPPPTNVPTDVVRANNLNPPTVFTFGPPTRPPGFPAGPLPSELPFVSTFTTPPSEESPEPATLILGILGSGALGLAGWVRRKKGPKVEESKGPKVEEPESP